METDVTLNTEEVQRYVDVSKDYVDAQDAAVLDNAKEYTDTKVPKKTSDLENDEGYLTEETVFINSPAHDITNTDITTWNNKSDFTGNYDDLNGKPTNVSDFENDADYATRSELPAVPTNVSELTNDSGFITSVVNDLTNYFLKEETYTREEVEGLINTIQTVNIEVVTVLPTTGQKPNIIYFVSKVGSSDDVYDEYMWINNAWEHIGSTAVDLSGYLTIADASSTYMLQANPVGTGSFSMNRKAGTDIGTNSTTEGYNSTASGNYSHSEGGSTTSSGNYSHSEGTNTTATGTGSHAEGHSTTASGTGAHAEGENTQAVGDRSHAEGQSTLSRGYNAHAEGQSTTASAANTHAEGAGTLASSANQHVQGKFNIEDTESKYADIIGGGTSDAARKNLYTVDWSGNVEAAGGYTGTGSLSMNRKAGTVIGTFSMTEGNKNTASGNNSHAEGVSSVASADQAHAEGGACTASGSNCHAEGNKSVASGTAAHAEGYMTVSSAFNSHAEGNGTIASGNNQHVEGRFNVADTANKYAHITGWGASDTDRKNIYTLDISGNAEFAGTVKDGSGTSIADLSSQIAALQARVTALEG